MTPGPTFTERSVARASSTSYAFPHVGHQIRRSVFGSISPQVGQIRSSRVIVFVREEVAPQEPEVSQGWVVEVV